MTDSDRKILRDLARRYRDLCETETNRRRIASWRDLNNLRPCRPLVHCGFGLAWRELKPLRETESDNAARAETWFHQAFFAASTGDDSVFEPWFPARAEMLRHPDGTWGVALDMVRDELSRGQRYRPVLRTIEDLERLKATEHRVLDPYPPHVEEMADAFGDILPVHVNRSTIYGTWGGTDLSTAAGYLFGLEGMLCALYDQPEMIHRFMAFTRDAVLANLKQGEAAGDWSMAETNNCGMPAYCDDLPDPAPNSHGARLKDLCFFTHAQEFEAVGPEQYEEFLLRYQMPIMALFGRVNYGCCETLDSKRGLLAAIPNLSKILAGPLADPGLYPERFGDRCVISWRPNPSLIAGSRFDENFQREQLRQGLEKLRGCHVEVHLHEPLTVQNDPARIARWTQIAIQEAELAA
ncbi:MAG: hypothetical protein ABIF82_03465 [Planctomycetota bacterium]